MATKGKTDAEIPDKEFHPERWMYAGIREHNRNRMHCWVTDLDTGERRYWSGPGRYVIGGYYVASAARTTAEDGGTIRVTKQGDPEYTGESADLETRRQLSAEDAAARVRLAMQTLERKHANDDALSAALRPLMRMYAKLRTGPDRDAFLVHVMAELGRAPYVNPEKLED